MTVNFALQMDQDQATEEEGVWDDDFDLGHLMQHFTERQLAAASILEQLSYELAGGIVDSEEGRDAHRQCILSLGSPTCSCVETSDLQVC